MRGYRPVLEKRVQEPPDERQLHDDSQEVAPGEEEHAEQHLHRPGLPDEQEDPVEEEEDDGDLDGVAPPRTEEPQLLQEAVHRTPSGRVLGRARAFQR